MEMYNVVSTNVHAIGYNAKDRILVIEYLAGGVYHYLRVPRKVFEELLSAPSKGTAVNKLVKGHYRYVKVR